jgi:hypothetical protein
LTITTYGYEAEFGTNVRRLAEQLHREGYTTDDSIHDYHCRCEGGCEFGISGAPYRIQSDSSCGGEVISNVLRTDYPEELHELTEILQHAAVFVDAEPNLEAGFHVHVRVADLTNLDRARILAEYLRWEATLEQVGAGLWTINRNNNGALRSLLAHVVERWQEDQDEEHELSAWREPRTRLHAYMTSNGSKRTYLARYLRGADRHVQLNTTNISRHGTWEFRLWNSTRSAWRMRMFVNISVAMCDPFFVERLHDVDVPNIDDAYPLELRDAFDAHGLTDVAEAINRQHEYQLSAGVVDMTPTLTCV